MTTWNPSDTSGGVTFSNNNLTVNATNNSWWYSCRATIGKNAGKWYWEVTLNNFNNCMIGVSTTNATYDTGYAFTATAYGFGYHGAGSKWNSSGGSAYGAAYGASDVIGVALDCDNRTLTFYKNGVSQGIAFSLDPTTYYPTIGVGVTATVNFGASSFVHTIPAGYSSIDSLVTKVTNYLQTIPHNSTRYNINSVELINISNRSRIGVVGTTKHNYIGV